MSIKRIFRVLPFIFGYYIESKHIILGYHSNSGIQALRIPLKKYLKAADKYVKTETNCTIRTPPAPPVLSKKELPLGRIGQ